MHSKSKWIQKNSQYKIKRPCKSFLNCCRKTKTVRKGQFGLKTHTLARTDNTDSKTE